MEANVNNQFLLGESNFGGSMLEQAVQNVLAEGLTGQLNMKGYPSQDKDAASLEFVYDVFVSQGNPGQLAPLNVINGALPLTANLDLRNSSYTLITRNPTSNQEVSTKSYTDTQDTNLQNQINLEITNRTNQDTNLQQQITSLSLKTLDQIPLAVQDLDINNNKIINLSDPTNLKDATNKEYVDDVFGTAQQQINTLDDKIDQEILDRTTADTNLQQQITSQGSQITTLTTSLNTEITNRTNADTNLQNQITTNTNNLNTEITNRTNADTNLQQQITSQTSQITTLTNRKLNEIPVPTGQLDLNNQNIVNGNNATFSKFIGDHSGIHYGTSYSSTPGSSNSLHVDQQSLSGQLLSLEIAIDSFVNNELAKKVNLWTSLADTETGGSLLFESTGTQRGKNRIWNLEAITPSNYDAGNARYKSQPLTCDALQYWPINRLLTATGDYSMGNFKITNLANPTQNQDASTKSYVDNYFPPKIQNSAIKSKLDCSGDNAIDIYVNNIKLGTFYQPVGQATTPLGLSSVDKIQFQSALNSISAYGSKSIDTNPLVLNTNGFYITSNDNQTANVQNILGLSSQYSPNVYLASGHINTTKYAILSTDSPTGLQLYSGLDNTNPYIQLFPTSASQAVPIKFSNKAGYSTTTAITDNNQFASKAYVDSQAGGSSNITTVPVGTILVWYSSTIPDGYLLCNGQSYNTTTYAELFTVLGVNTVPNLQGYFLRGLDTSGTVDPGGASRTIGSIQAEDYKQHNHTGINGGNFAMYQAGTNSGWGWTNGTAYVGTSTVTANSGGTETRPVNRAVNYIIRASPVNVNIPSQINTSQLLVNSSLDFATGGYKIQGSTPTASNDYATKLYVDSNIGASSQIINSVVNTSKLVANQTELTNGSTPLNMNSQKITGLATPTTSTDAVTKAYADSLISGGVQTYIQQGSNLAELVNTNNFRVRNSGQSQYAKLINTVSYLHEDYLQDSYWYDSSTSAILKRLTPSNLFLCRPITIQASSSTTQSACLYISRQSGSQFTSKTYALQVVDNPTSTNGCLFDAYCAFNKPADFTTTTWITAQANGANNPYQNTSQNALSLGYISGRSNSDTVLSVNGYIDAIGFNTIVPVSQRNYKSDIQLIQTDDLLDVDLYTFYFNKQKLIDEFPDQQELFDTVINTGQQRGFIIDQVDCKIPQRYKKPTSFSPNINTVEQGTLQMDLLAMLLKERRNMQQQISSLEQQILDQETRIKRLEDIILLGH